jgi:hypothetical protein
MDEVAPARRPGSEGGRDLGLAGSSFRAPADTRQEIADKAEAAQPCGFVRVSESGLFDAPNRQARGQYSSASARAPADSPRIAGHRDYAFEGGLVGEEVEEVIAVGDPPQSLLDLTRSA